MTIAGQAGRGRGSTQHTRHDDRVRDTGAGKRKTKKKSVETAGIAQSVSRTDRRTGLDHDETTVREKTSTHFTLDAGPARLRSLSPVLSPSFSLRAPRAGRRRP